MANKKLRIQRKLRIRKNIKGTLQVPRLSVFRSNLHIYAQLIDDQNGKTLVSASDTKMKDMGQIEKATQVGELLASLARKQKIEKAVFDRGGHKYHGRIKALAEGVRKGGLIF